MNQHKIETIVGIFVLLGLLCVGYMTVKLGKVSFLKDDSYRVTAGFISVTGLRTGNPVDMWGIEIGTVEKIIMDQENQKAVVQMKIKKDVKIYDDAIASIKTEGLMGDQYISIDPGGSGTLIKPNGTITETQAPVDIIGLISKYAFGDIKKQ
ncbi:MAG TPA: outer membrane lipid asymmetry maintenance protein MlaD [Smithella sp.]|nr:outer membrane lipid asymmetry maintenance protein MlaD [Smithella sp.]HOU49695.1 outer membrane lipid asymmetry maintenance protein MlaD [Smithella sp.]HQG64453.1 outer membrane lipid asymmetry maintenance protein MlaD [Smithella sp.]HQH15756.1 outer membrane lipid asymmetry maintenance protein MlaD [Smithella sp.]HQI71827.1 outer membrane lipid asymmetry maintenance protein MlaD [Smithella sp.]